MRRPRREPQRLRVGRRPRRRRWFRNPTRRACSTGFGCRLDADDSRKRVRSSHCWPSGRHRWRRGRYRRVQPHRGDSGNSYASDADRRRLSPGRNKKLRPQVGGGNLLISDQYESINGRCRPEIRDASADCPESGIPRRRIETVRETSQRATDLPGYDHDNSVGLDVMSLHPTPQAKIYESLFERPIAEQTVRTETLPNGDPVYLLTASGNEIQSSYTHRLFQSKTRRGSILSHGTSRNESGP